MKKSLVSGFVLGLGLCAAVAFVTQYNGIQVVNPNQEVQLQLRKSGVNLTRPWLEFTDGDGTLRFQIPSSGVLPAAYGGAGNPEITSTVILDSSGTNVVVDYSTTDFNLTTSTNLNFSVFTNAPTSGASSTTITIFASGGNVTVNSALTEKIANSSVSFPVVITNGDWGIFAFRSYGTNSNALVYTFAH